MHPRLATLVVVAALSTIATVDGAQRQPHSRLFPPEQLGLLEGPDREEWQQAERIMDALGVYDSARVADLGAGGGWFTIRLARRVGPNGVVYAEDVQPQMIEAIKRRVASLNLKNVQPILGTAEDPRLVPELNAVLIVDTFPQLSDPVGVLRHVAKALARNGRLGIVDFKPDGAGGPGPPLDERLDPEAVKRDAASAGLVLKSHETFLRYQYLLVFGK